MAQSHRAAREPVRAPFACPGLRTISLTWSETPPFAGLRPVVLAWVTTIPGGSRFQTLRTPPRDEPAQALVESDACFEPKLLTGFASVGHAAGHGSQFPFRPILDSKVRLHGLQQHFGQLVETGFHAAGDVVSLTSVAGRGGQQEGAGHVFDKDQIYRLAAVPEDDGRKAAFDPVHPTDQHLGVGAM